MAAALAAGEGAWTLRGRLTGVRLLRTRRRGFSLVRGRLTDATGALPVVWFNRPYLPRQVDPAVDYLLHGEMRGGELLNPSCEPAESALQGARVLPVYPAIGGIGEALLRRLLDRLLAEVDLKELPEPLPEDLRRRYALPSWGGAIRALHQPEEADLRGSPGHRRLVYGELLELRLAIALDRARHRERAKPHFYQKDLPASGREALPFALTAAQERTLGEIAADLASPWPMLRLLQGDVGSGKTVVAALSLALALESGLQGAFMAPTELLAEQHFAQLDRLLGGRYRIGLFTSATPAGERAALAAGEIQLAVGTHALIQQGLRFARLGLAVIDEQHRFGVMQRQALQGKGERPDLLVMTATPIPRSLALTAYGDLDISALDELPPGRTPVATEIQPASRRKAVYGRLRRALAAGARAYVVFPLIEESGEVPAASVTELGERLRHELGDVPSAVLHGRLPAVERAAVMAAFARGEVRVLLATTVIEVGVDVPEATWMVIESAERFGLSQLHQLRGRVGRGVAASCCIAIAGKPTPEAQRRLEVFAATQDGFRLAEADLEMRGPGDLLGTRQAGIAGLHGLQVADLLRDRDWLERAREDAEELLRRWDDPELAALRERIEAELARRGRGGGG